ncbi:hypothetical protein PCANC_11786 [Puccinia coronata f. sp. avenae]|uniref:Uncharacterized protein n=1 Tax=Puccinia coronata f. sp. avenae TaxID=200324 RepID=A0A2N5SV63_9BASI|nr:hypothetical protein PCANC_11786 [Puccinia coronata f. sp. avenae]
MLFERSVPAVVDRAHELLEKLQPMNHTPAFSDGPSDDGILPGNLPDSPPVEDPGKKRSGRGKHSGQEGKGNDKAIAGQQKKVDSLRHKLDQAITKIEALEGAGSEPYDAKGGDKAHHHHSGRKHHEPTSHVPDTQSPASPQGIEPTSPDHPGKAPLVKRSDYASGPARFLGFAPTTGDFPGKFAPTVGEEGTHQYHSGIDMAHIPSDNHHH